MGHFHPFSMTFFCSDLTIEASIFSPKAWTFGATVRCCPASIVASGGKSPDLIHGPHFWINELTSGYALGLDWAHGLFGRYGRLKLHQHVYESRVDVRNLCQISMILDEI